MLPIPFLTYLWVLFYLIIHHCSRAFYFKGSFTTDKPLNHWAVVMTIRRCVLTAVQHRNSSSLNESSRKNLESSAQCGASIVLLWINNGRKPQGPQRLDTDSTGAHIDFNYNQLQDALNQCEITLPQAQRWHLSVVCGSTSDDENRENPFQGTGLSTFLLFNPIVVFYLFRKKLNYFYLLINQVNIRFCCPVEVMLTDKKKSLCNRKVLLS